MLAWTGWGLLDGMTDTDDVFQYFQDHWTDQGGLMKYGWDWWFDGTNNTQGWPNGWAQVDVPGGGFYPAENFYDYYHSRSGSSQSLAAIDEYLHAGYGVTIGIYGPGGHAITVWGYNYNPDNPADYYGVWVTDSDDSKYSSDPPDRLRYYEVEYISGYWYLQDYYGSDAWHIDVVQALAPGDPAPVPPAANNQIRGSVWQDLDADGLADAGEQAMAEETVYLDLDGNGQFDAGEPTTQTDAQGDFEFTELDDGLYYVRHDVANDWIQTRPDSGYYTLDLQDGAVAENIDFGTREAGDFINFNDYSLYSYGGAWQDRTGSTTVENGGAALHITGNRWKAIDLSYDVTATTVLEFDFRSTCQGEVHAIGFDTDLGQEHGRAFQLYGTQTWGHQDYDSYDGAAPELKHYQISIGQYYTGQMDYLFFVNDHDVADPAGEGIFSNLRVYEQQPDGETTVDFADCEVNSYGGVNQDRSGTVTVEDDGASLRIQGNLWKSIDLVYDVTPNTVLEFDFSSSSQGEVHGIGFDADSQLSADRTFQLYGTQTWGQGGYKDYADTAPGSKHYQIEVGHYYTGQMTCLFFANDHDVANPTGESVFSNVHVYEQEAGDDGGDDSVIDFSACLLQSYGGANQDRTGPVAVEDGGATLHIEGNRWKAVECSRLITPNTVLDFDFASTGQGEVHGIGLDTDLTLSAGRTFQLYGTQTWGRQDYDDYAATAPGTKHYQIPVGQFYMGEVNYLFFANDHDVADPAGEGIFSNVRVYEAASGASASSVDFAAWVALSRTTTGYAAAGISPPVADLLLSRLPDRLSDPFSGLVSGPARACLPASHDWAFAQSIFRPAQRFNSLGNGPENLQTAESSVFDGAAFATTSANMPAARWQEHLEAAISQFAQDRAGYLASW